MEMENLGGQKKNPIIVIILVILVLGLGGYILYSELKDKEQENTNETEKPNSNFSIVLTEKFLDSTIRAFDTFYSGDYFGYFYKKDKILVNQMDNKALLYMAIDNIFDDVFKDVYIYDGNKYYIDETEILNSAKELFGNDVIINNENIVYNGEEYIYDANTKKYSVTFTGGKGGPTDLIYSKVLEYNITNTDIEVMVNFAYLKSALGEDSSYNYHVYKTMDTNSKIGSVMYYGSLDNNITSKLNKYKFTYKIENDKVYFYSSEIIK